MAHPGQPTAYKGAATIKASRAFLDSCYDFKSVLARVGDKTVQVKVKGKKGQPDSWKDEKRPEYRVLDTVRLPTIEGLALHLKIHRDTLYSWEKTHPEFSDIMEELRQRQANALIHHGVEGRYNSTIAKVLLTKHGYREGIEQSGPGGGPIEVSDERQKQIEDAIDEVL